MLFTFNICTALEHLLCNLNSGLIIFLNKIIDFFLFFFILNWKRERERGNKKDQAFVEVKNVTLKRNKDFAEFPDAPTARGQKHLLELISAKKKGYQAFLIFLIQREDCNSFKISKDIDKKYYENFIEAKKKGVNFLCYSSKVTNKEINLKKKIEIKFEWKLKQNKLHLSKYITCLFELISLLFHRIIWFW